MRTLEYTYKIADERGIRIADSVGANFSRALGCHTITEVKRRKVDLLIGAGFDVAAAKGNGVPRFRRNGKGPLVLLAHAVMIAEAYADGAASRAQDIADLNSELLEARNGFFGSAA